MQLTAVQEDGLIELLNIGFGRAGASLSELTGQRVSLEIPHVAVHPLDNLEHALSVIGVDQVASVHQIFSGPVAGDALLIMDFGGAGRLKQLLTDEPPLPLSIDASAREVLTEVGNILINACLGTFGNVLDVPVAFAVPHLNLDTLRKVVESLVVNNEGLRYALVVQAAFRLREAEITGYIVIVLSVGSLDKLIRGIEHWETE